MKLFISYSHKDENLISQFIVHLAPLKEKKIVEEWYDRKINAGTEYQDTIDDNLDNADIICLFISPDFLNSSACKKEMEKALELRSIKSIPVIPIILYKCGWLDVDGIKDLLALPTDGKSVTSFSSKDEAFYDIYEGLKNTINGEQIIKSLKISESFMSFLIGVDLLSKAHPNKETVKLDDIFVFPNLAQYDELREFEKNIDAEKVLQDFHEYRKILFAGENQAGKTTLCKKLYLLLFSKGLVPIYIPEGQLYRRKIGKAIEKSYVEQYDSADFKQIDKKRIVPILDNFHLAINKEEHINFLSEFINQVIVVDDVFGLNFKEDYLIKAYKHFKIKELSSSLRYKLIEKWECISNEQYNSNCCKNKNYQDIDCTTEYVNTALGKVIGSGIMPAFPFFVLSIISTYKTFEKPLDQEITSQGYCYQALIYLFLRKQGVKNDEIDTYVNFLTEFSFFIYTEVRGEVPAKKFEEFLKKYLDTFNLPVKQSELLSNLQNSRLINLDDCNNYSFSYLYLYYFFVAKYLAEHIDESKKDIDNIVNNLHTDENAYIAVFISHHTKNDYVLDEVILNAYCLFEKCEPATLSRKEMKFFDEKKDIIIKAALPPKVHTPEMERENRLDSKPNKEFLPDLKDKSDLLIDEKAEKIALDLRRSIKTVEVMGRIIKNRAGSLEKERLETIFEEGMKVHLRILSSFFDIIKGEEEQNDVIEYIKERLSKIASEKGKGHEIKPEKLKKISERIFWNLNFFVVYGFIDKIVHSLGSDKLLSIIEKICDQENTPASFLVKHGILMWYEKNLQIDNIKARLKDDGFSKTAINVLEFMIVNHCSMHSIGFKTRQKVANIFKIPTQELVLQQVKQSSN
jgi:hypothetical protein